jgi:GDP-4-dehydro-6-deoxy-D-mannose reductase
VIAVLFSASTAIAARGALGYTIAALWQAEEGSVKILITGVDGFAGGHLARHLLESPELTVHGTTLLPTDQHRTLAKEGALLRQVDLTNAADVLALLEELAPDDIYHLAAQSFVPRSFENPWETLQNNIQGQLNVLHGVATIGLNARVLVVGSSEEYGPVRPDEVPITEEQPLCPANPYSVSKVAQDMLGLQYFISHGVRAIRVRPFNHIGPGQSERFVAPAFACQIAAIEQGQREPVIYVGNLSGKRDFTDVRDMVRAYRLLMEKGQPGEVYNIGAGETHSIQELLDILLSLTAIPIKVETDPARVRPLDVPIVVCDARKMREATGWGTTIRFEDTLRDILDDWRSRMGR